MLCTLVVCMPSMPMATNIVAYIPTVIPTLCHKFNSYNKSLPTFFNHSASRHHELDSNNALRVQILNLIHIYSNPSSWNWPLVKSDPPPPIDWNLRMFLATIPPDYHTTPPHCFPLQLNLTVYPYNFTVFSYNLTSGFPIKLHLTVFPYNLSSLFPHTTLPHSFPIQLYLTPFPYNFTSLFCHITSPQCFPI